jgi:hypothetical protein
MANKGFSTLDSILARIEQLFLTVVIGLVPPILFGLAGWRAGRLFASEQSIQYFVLGGFLLGVLLDLLFLRRLARRALRGPLLVPILIYLLYSVGLFVFFTGIPVINAALGPVGGYLMGIRLRVNKAQQPVVEKTAQHTGLFTTGVLALACAAALAIAARDTSLETYINGLLALAKPFSRTAILALLTGGTVLLAALEYLITRAAVKFARFL